MGKLEVESGMIAVFANVVTVLVGAASSVIWARAYNFIAAVALVVALCKIVREAEETRFEITRICDICRASSQYDWPEDHQMRPT